LALCHAVARHPGHFTGAHPDPDAQSLDAPSGLVPRLNCSRQF
jgi:hypothetical protein